MYCGKCGTENTENASFCKNCGERLKGVQRPASSRSGENRTIEKLQTQHRQQPAANIRSKKRNRRTFIPVVVVVLLLLAAFMLFGGRSYKATIDQFVDAQFRADAAAIFNLIPDEYIDYTLEEEGYDRDDFNDLLREVDKSIQDQLDTIKGYLGENWSVSYEIVRVEDIKGDTLKEFKKAYRTKDVKISEAKFAEVEITITVDERDASFWQDISLIKVGRSWYLDVDSMGSLFWNG